MYRGFCKERKEDVTPADCVRCELATPYLRDCEHLDIKETD